MTFVKILLKNKIILGLLLGLIYGLLAIYFGWIEFTIDWIKPFGTIFIKLLKLLAIPFIFISLVQGISSMSNISQLSKLGIRTLSLYIITTVIAISIGLTVVNLIKPARFFSEEKKEQLQTLYLNNTEDTIALTESQNSSPLQLLVDIVPENIIESARDNRNMLQIIFFALLFSDVRVSDDSRGTNQPISEVT